MKAILDQNRQLSITGKKPYVIDWPGEFEIEGVTVRSFQTTEDKLGYQITAENVRFYIPGVQAFASAEERLQELGNIDVLIVCADLFDWSAKDWKKLSEEIEPRLMVFDGNGEKTQAILKEIGGGEAETTAKKDVSAKNLPADKTIYLILE